jgi:dCMP deaminase
MTKAIVAYVPVLHDGYRKLFEKHSDVNVIYVFGDEVTTEFDYLKKDIRALKPELIQKALGGWNLNQKVEILDKKGIEKLQKEAVVLVMPDEDICRELAEKYFPGKEIIFDRIFLRWDKHNSVAEIPVNPDVVVSREDFDKEVVGKILKEAAKSADFWRHIGAAIVKEKEIVGMTYNEHQPSNHVLYANGDPRGAFKKGINIDTVTSIHAEARLIAEAAKRGETLEGSSMYVTTFPCPTCAKLIAFSGIKKLYAAGGYGVLDGETILKAKGVKIIFVETDQKEESKKWEGYKK